MLVSDTYLRTRLASIGKFTETDYILHMEGDSKTFEEYENVIATGLSNPAIYVVVEWKDIEMPLMFAGGHVTGISPSDELTLLAFHMKQDSYAYITLFTRLDAEKYLLNRSISIRNVLEEINSSRFSRLILE